MWSNIWTTTICTHLVGDGLRSTSHTAKCPHLTFHLPRINNTKVQAFAGLMMLEKTRQSLEQCPAEVIVYRSEYQMVSVTYWVQWQVMAHSTSGYQLCASSWCASVYRSVLHTYPWSNKVSLCVLGEMNTVLKPVYLCVLRTLLHNLSVW